MTGTSENALTRSNNQIDAVLVSNDGTAGGAIQALGEQKLTGKVLVTGHTPAYVYESGRIDRSLPFEELQRRSLVNAAAQAADQAPDFSRRIRAGLPGPAGR